MHGIHSQIHNIPSITIVAVVEGKVKTSKQQIPKHLLALENQLSDERSKRMQLKCLEKLFQSPTKSKQPANPNTPEVKEVGASVAGAVLKKSVIHLPAPTKIPPTQQPSLECLP